MPQDTDFPCEQCGHKEHYRIRRRPWQRWLLPRSRRYKCAWCGQITFRPFGGGRHRGRRERTRTAGG